MTIAFQKNAFQADGTFQTMPDFLSNDPRLPTLASGKLANGALSGGFKSSFSYHVNTDGTVATSSTKDVAAYVSSDGWLINPDGSIVISADKQAGAKLGKTGVLMNPDGSAVVTTSETGAFLNSSGVMVNADGAMIVSDGTT